MCRGPLLAALVCVSLGGAQQQESAAFRSGTNLVQFTVVALDKHGKPVTVLRKEDVIVIEDGKRREISLFRYEGVDEQGRPQPLGPGQFTNRVEHTAGPPRNVTAIVIDAADQVSMRAEVLQFARELPATSRLGVYVMGSGLRVVHDFTDDLELLRTRSFEAIPASESASVDVVLMEALGNHLAGFPGRKSLIWITGGTPTSKSNDRRLSIDYNDVRATAQRLASLGVTVYPQLRQTPEQRTQLTARKRLIATMDRLAEISGGRVSKNSTDLAERLRSVAADARATYTIGFVSSAPMDSEWRKLAVKVNRRDVETRHRQGYFARASESDLSEWSNERWHGAMSEPLGSTALRLDADCRITDGVLTTVVQVLTDGRREADQEFAIGEKKADGTFLLRRYAARSPNTTFTSSWKLAAGSVSLRLVVRDRPTGRYGTLDVPVKSIPTLVISRNIQPQQVEPMAVTGAAEPAQGPLSDDPFIERARALALQFVATLPKYLVRQETERSIQVGNQPGWRLQDRISAELLYESRTEVIRSVQLNGKPVAIEQVQETGTWSTGNYGGLLQGLFDPRSQTSFRKRGTANVAGRDATVYSYSVQRANSAWKLIYGNQRYTPAYEGTVWLDAATAQVLRFKMQARGLPASFAMGRAEASTTYGFVRIGSGEYLLPVSSTSLGCYRPALLAPAGRGPSRANAGYCAENVIRFREYRQFGAESKIDFGQ